MQKKALINFEFKTIQATPLFTNDAIVIGLLLFLLAIIFYTSRPSNIQEVLWNCTRVAFVLFLACFLKLL